MKVALFDLDGTLTESGEGITKSVQHALACMGRPEPDLDKLKCFIGPPLMDQFMAYAGFDQQEAKQAVTYMRQRYSTIGIFENKPYPGVEHMLRELKACGYRLAIASSKPERFVKVVLEHFHLASYFEETIGDTLDGTRTGKSEVIEEALRRLDLLNDRDEVVMVGDREHDVIGAKSQGVTCVAVAYGYGTWEELEATKPGKIVKTVAELEHYLVTRKVDNSHNL